MTAFQKIIKYGAIAFAIYLCFIIIAIIIGAITAIFGITTGFEGMFEESPKANEQIVTNWEQEYSDINSLDIDLSVGKLIVKKGNRFKVETSGTSNGFRCRVEGKKLKIEEENLSHHHRFFNMSDTAPEVVIYLPENTLLKEVKIETGMNDTNIEFLKAENVKIAMGVGKYKIKDLHANYAKIEAGAGEADIHCEQVKELRLEGGIGRLALTGNITQKAKIECGAGKVEVNLDGSLNDYKINTQTGIGNFEVEGKKVANHQILGNGDIVIEVEAGMGEVTIDFKE